MIPSNPPSPLQLEPVTKVINSLSLQQHRDLHHDFAFPTQPQMADEDAYNKIASLQTEPGSSHHEMPEDFYQEFMTQQYFVLKQSQAQR